MEPLHDTHGQIYGCVSVCVDLTDRTLAKVGLRNADRRKDELLATLWHELRNPLAPIRSAIEVIRLAGGDQELVERVRATMERQLLHLVRITDDLIEVARITQDKVQLRRERVDLGAVLQSAIEGTDARAHTLTVQLPDGPIWADVDVTRIAQSLSNVLSNAAKYTNLAARAAPPLRLTPASPPSSSATSASAFLPRCCRAFSTCSRSFRRIEIAPMAGSASGSPSRAGWSSCTAARSMRVERRSGPRQPIHDPAAGRPQRKEARFDAGDETARRA